MTHYKIYHAFVSGKSDSPDSSLVRPSNWNAGLQYGNDAGTGPSGTDAHIRKLLMAATTFYVSTSGSDISGTGSSGAPWQTGQTAMDWIATNLDFGGQTVTVQFSSGTYTNGVIIKECVGQATLTDLIFQGSSTTPTNVLVSVTSDNCFYSEGSGVKALIKGFELRTTTGGDCLQSYKSGQLEYADINFGACAGNHCKAFGPASHIGLNSDSYTISGGAACHWSVENGGNIALFATSTITLTGTPSFTTAFGRATEAATLTVAGYGPVTFSGAATGFRYSVTLNGVIETYGAGATYFPGSSAGTSATGGQYA